MDESLTWRITVGGPVTVSSPVDFRLEHAYGELAMESTVEKEYIENQKRPVQGVAAMTRRSALRR